ncbi:hypothetical protein JCM12298_26850 [Desulfothermus naphthae]
MLLTEKLKEMSKKEKLVLMEQIWDSLLQEDDGINSPQWHKEILEERMAKMKKGEAKFITINELR